MKAAEMLDPLEAARKLGVTVKALRVYEASGLLKPGRSAAGWRVYGPAHVARVHEILALKALGLTLKQIADLLKGRAGDLGRSLATHRTSLEVRRQAIDHALVLVCAAERQIAAGKSPTVADLAALAHSIAKPELSWEKELGRIYARHLRPAERRKVSQNRVDWIPLIAELKRLTAIHADPSSPRARKLMSRWTAAGLAQTGGDEGINTRSYDAWKEALDDPKLSPRLPMGKAETEYLLRLEAAAIAAPKTGKS